MTWKSLSSAVALSVIAPVLLFVPQVGAPPASAQATAAVPMGWAGELTMSSSTTTQSGSFTAVEVTSGTYAALRPVGTLEEDGSGTYAADVDMTFNHQGYGDCNGESGHLNWNVDFAFKGRSEDAVNAARGAAGFLHGGIALQFKDKPDGTYFMPWPLGANIPEQPFCSNVGGPPPPVLDQYYTMLGYQPGSSALGDVPLVDTDPDPHHLVGTSTYGPDNIPGIDYEYAAYSYVLTYDLRRVVDQCSAEALYPAYQAGAPEHEAFLEFELDLTWCEGTTGPRNVQSAARGRTLISPFEHAVESIITELFTFNDVWRESTVTRSGNSVTAVGRWEQCSGIPLLSKVKHLGKVAKGLRVLGKLIRKIDTYKPVTRKIDRLIRIAARQLEKAADGGIGKWVAKQAFRTLTTAIDALPRSVQKKLTKATYYVVFDFYLSKPWAKKYLTNFIPDVPLSQLMSNKLVCKTGWTPVIAVELVTGATPTYTDLMGDGAWDVRRVR